MSKQIYSFVLRGRFTVNDDEKGPIPFEWVKVALEEVVLVTPPHLGVEKHIDGMVISSADLTHKGTILGKEQS